MPAWAVDLAVGIGAGNKTTASIKVWSAPEHVGGHRWDLRDIFVAMDYSCNGKNKSCPKRLKNMRGALGEWLAARGFALAEPFFGRSLASEKQRRHKNSGKTFSKTIVC